MEKKYTLEVTESALRIIADCVEDCHRFASGETEMSNTTALLDSFGKVRKFLKGAKDLVVPNLGGYDSYDWSGYGCENDCQRRFIAQSYPIYRDIRHFLALEKGINNVYSQHETLRCAESGEPIKIKAVGGRVEMYAVVFTDGVSSWVKSMHTDYKEAVDSALKFKRKNEENGNDHYGDYWWLKIVKQDENGKMGMYAVNADGSVEKKK